MIRPEVAELLKLGKMPSYGEPRETIEVIEAYEKALHSITRAVTDEEAVAMLEVFGEDDLYGLVWTLIHLVESAPNWITIGDQLPESNNYWIDTLKIRIANWKINNQE